MTFIDRPTMALGVFVSHSVGTDEIPIVEHLAAALHQAGIGAYLAIHDRQPGASLSAKIQSNIDQSDVLVALYSKKGSDSAWVQQEVGFALGRGKRVIVLVEKGVKPTAMLEGAEYLPFDPAEPRRGVDDLTAYLARLKAERDVLIAMARADRAEAEARQAEAVLGAIVVVGVLIVLFWALSRS